MPLKDQPMVKKLSGFNCPLVLPWFPWFWFRNEETRLRKLAGRWLWVSQCGIGQRSILIIKSLVWPFFAALAHLLEQVAYGTEVKAVFGKSIPDQIAKRIWFLCWRGYNAVPNYLFYFYEYGKDVNWDRFLAFDESVLLNLAVVDHVDSELVDNKLRFYERCVELGIAMVPVLGVFENGGISDRIPFNGLPQEDLYFKYISGAAGKDIYRWKWRKDRQCWERNGEFQDEAGLLDRFKDISRKRTFILQPSARNHDFFRDLTEGGTCGLRVLSLCSVEGEIEVVHNYVIIPSGDSPTNHGPGGGLKAKMDMESHCFENVVWTTPHLGVSATHPVTGAQVNGLHFEMWPEVEAFVIEAHKHFPECFSIAWDLVYTPDGVQILEGNTQWGLINGCFIGESNYPEWILKKLESKALEGGKFKKLMKA
jgi:hypothetical protein